MNPLQVDLGDRSYPIYIGSDIFNQLPYYQNTSAVPMCWWCADSNTAEHYLPSMMAMLSDYHCQSITLPAGESHKTLDTVSSIYDALMQHRFDRNSTLIALGGGVVGDICGFAAASFQRGVTFIQVPTTLLAQVDSPSAAKPASTTRSAKT